MTSTGRRVLLVHRFFDPDVTTYSQMLSMIAERLHEDGFDVSVATTQPSYNAVYDGPRLAKETVDRGVRVIRWAVPGGGSSAGRLGGGVLFCLLLLWHALRHRGRYDMIMVSTVPPVLMGLAGLAASRLLGARLVYHCMDLYPEIALASGVAERGLVASMARRLDNLTIRNSSLTIVLSEDMARTIARRGIPTRNVVVRNNFAIGSCGEKAADPLPPGLEPSGRFRLLFAGNIGRFQGLETLLDGFDAYVRSGDREVELVFLGAGGARPALAARVEALGLGDVVHFVDHQPLDVAMAAIAASEVAVVSLTADLISSAYPSKTIMYLEMGCRILAVVEDDSDLAQLICKNDLGTIAAPGNVSQIADAISRERTRRHLEGERGRAQAVARSEFGSAEILNDWCRILADLEDLP